MKIRFSLFIITWGELGLKKRVTIELIMLLFLGLILPIFSANAEEMDLNAASTSRVTELKVNSVITNWVLNEEENTLYAISQTSKSLLFINATTMTIDGSLTLSGSPTDIVKEDGKLYISALNNNEIYVVDTATREIEKTLALTVSPGRVVVNKNKIYYAEDDQWVKIYEYDIDSNTEITLPLPLVYEADLAINKEKNILYIGESGISGGNMYYYSIEKGEILSKTNYRDGYGFSYPEKNVIFYGESVYYASRDFNAENATRVNGNYESGNSVIFVKGDLVYTNTSIYENASHRKLGDSAFQMNLVEATNNTLYVYNKNSNSINKYNHGNKVIDSSNVISLISGIATPEIQGITKSSRIDRETTVLDLTSKLDHWILEEGSNTLYAISSESKALFFINKNTLNIEKSITFTSAPTDIIKDEGKIYVAINDIWQIAVIDAEKRDVEKILYTTVEPYKIVKNKNKIYYAGNDQWVKIHEYDLISSIDRTLATPLIHQADIAINKDKNILYIGESGLSGSDLYYFSIDKNEVISKNNHEGYGFPFPKRSVIFHGESVYYAGRSFDAENANVINGQYTEGTINYVTENLVLTADEIYDKGSFELIGYWKTKANLIECFNETDLYIYNKEGNRVYKIVPESPYVIEDVNEDGEVDITDVAALAVNYNKNSFDNSWREIYDVNMDGLIDIFDLVLVSLKI